MIKKIFLSVFTFLFLSTIAHAATWYACTGNHNWNGANSWTSVQADQSTCVASTGNPVAGDTAVLNSTTGSNTVTISAAAAAASITMTGYTGTLALGNFNITVTGGTVTLGGTITAGTGGLVVSGAETLTSNAIVWPGITTFSGATTTTFTASSTWQSTGLCTISNTALLTPSTATLNCAGGLTTTANMSSSSVAKINISGGTWIGGSNADAIYGPLILGSITLSGNQTYNGSSLTFTSSSTITGATSNLLWLSPNNSITITITPNSVTYPGTLYEENSGNTFTVAGGMNVGGITVTSSDLIITGAYNWTIGNLYMDSTPYGDADYLTLVTAQTYTVTGALILAGTTVPTSSNSLTVQSSTSTAAKLNYTGTSANCSVYGMTFTHINAAGSNQAIYNYSGGTLTGTTNIININQNNIGGVYIQ